MSALTTNLIVATMRTDLLNWCHLVSISKNVVFYAFLMVLTFKCLVNLLKMQCIFAKYQLV